jgi:hypothetical protein
MEYKSSDIIPFFEGPYLDMNVHTEKEFTDRLHVFSQGMLRSFSFDDAVLIGGSLYIIVTKGGTMNDLELCDSDIDLFITAKDSLEAFSKLERVLTYFQNYAKEEERKILFIFRGMLIDILIQGKRRVQVLLTSYTSLHQCLGDLNMAHLHMFYTNGTLYTTELAMDCIRKKETVMCRAPVKDVKARKIQEQGITWRGKVLTSVMDPHFYATINILDAMKETIDLGKDPLVEEKEEGNRKDLQAFISTDIHLILEKALLLASVNWSKYRTSYLDLYGINHDIDIFDLHIRLPADDIVRECKWYSSRNKRAGEILMIDTPGSSPSPAIFIVFSLQVTESIYVKVVQDLLISIPILETQCVNDLFRKISGKDEEELIFIYNCSFSKFLDAERLPVEYFMLRTDELYTVSFMVLAVEDEDPVRTLVAEIYELSSLL